MEAECKMCGGKVSAPEDAIKGEIVSCSDCGIEYEINSTESGILILTPAEEVKEDWGE